MDVKIVLKFLLYNSQRRSHIYSDRARCRPPGNKFEGFVTCCLFRMLHTKRTTNIERLRPQSAVTTQKLNTILGFEIPCLVCVPYLTLNTMLDIHPQMFWHLSQAQKNLRLQNKSPPKKSEVVYPVTKNMERLQS